MRKKPEDENDESFEYRIWYNTYKDLIARNLDEACDKAKEYKPEIKFQTRDDLQNQYATQGKKSKSKHKDTSTQGERRRECLICFSKDHNGVQCPFLGLCQELAKQQLAKSNRAHTMIDFAF